MSNRQQTGAVEASDGATRLIALAALASELGSEHVASEAAELAARLTEGRFFVACVGQFKRGKSTLIGALIGESVLPTGFIPVTAVPTVIRFGPTRRARIRTTDGAWQEIPLHDLEQYVSEEHNPENVKGVAGAEVFVPSPLLATGMCLVDTPGLGSVFSGNTAATQAFIPHIDAALVVTGSDPPWPARNSSWSSRSPNTSSTSSSYSTRQTRRRRRKKPPPPPLPNASCRSVCNAPRSWCSR